MFAYRFFPLFLERALEPYRLVMSMEASLFYTPQKEFQRLAWIG